MAVQFAYLFGEAISDWTDTVKTAQINSVFAEVIAPHSSDPTMLPSAISTLRSSMT